MKSILKLSIVSTIALALALGFSACGGTATPDKKPADNKAATNTKPADNKAATDTKPADATTADSIGVPECDEYIKKYEMCLNNKVPEAARAGLKTSFEQTRKAWKDAAASPQGKTALATGCKTALETAKSSMTAYGCEW
jgi:hypothetical protein